MCSLKVPGMMCMHCVASITAAAEAVATDVNVDLAAKTVFFQGDPEKVKAALDEIGFDAE